jgi:hypothetical protein
LKADILSSSAGLAEETLGAWLYLVLMGCLSVSRPGSRIS